MSLTRQLGVVAAVLISGTAGVRAESPNAADFAKQLLNLTSKNDKATRLNALSWINTHSRSTHAVAAIPTLETCIRKAAEWEVRQQAVLVLSVIAKEAGKPCPLVVFEAMTDPEDLVRYQAGACTAMFKTFPPGSVDLLIRGTASKNADIRENSVSTLGYTAGKDPKALAAMEKARQDPVLEVRHSAHCALFIAKDRLIEHLPYVIRVREDPDSILSPGPADTEIGKKERTLRNLISLGMAVHLAEWSETRPDELAEALMKLLADPSPILRRGAANLIGVVQVKVSLPPARPGVPLLGPDMSGGSGLEPLLPRVDPPAAEKPKNQTPRERSKVALRLDKLQATARLRTLERSDPDMKVRVEAIVALGRIAQWNSPK